MNTEHLRLFTRLAATHNISRAGQELGLSPAVASAHVQRLEESLGVRLVHRTTRKVSLTEEGEAFLPHAEDVLASVEAARASVGAGESDPSGTLRVTAPASFGRMHLVPALQGFAERYPKLSLDLRLSDTIVDVVEGGFDVAIRNSSLKDSSLIARKLAPDERIVCASPAYLARSPKLKTPKDIQDHSCINLAGLKPWMFETPNGPERVKTKGWLQSDSGDAVREACVDGLGLSINSRWSAYQHLQRGDLVQVLPDFPLVSDTAIWAVYPSSRLLAPKVRAFIDYYSQVFGSPPYWG
ncbi:MAG: LysR family transcriptional regulator [Granulosicoccaceae bacterium]